MQCGLRRQIRNAAPRHAVSIQLARQVGSNLALASTASRMLLANQPDDQLRAYLERIELVADTHMTQLDKDARPVELLSLRVDGHGVSENQYGMGLRGVSVPLKNKRGLLVGALSVSMTIGSCSPGPGARALSADAAFERQHADAVGLVSRAVRLGTQAPRRCRQVRAPNRNGQTAARNAPVCSR